MKIYKVKMMSGQEIPLEGKEALDALIEGANRGAKLILTKHGVINAASIDSITLHHKLMSEISDSVRMGKGIDESIKDSLGSGVFAEEAKQIKS